MNPVIVIPTFVSARRRKDGGSILTTYDHMTPISQPGELGRCLNSLQKVRGIGQIVVLVASEPTIENQAAEKVQATVSQFPGLNVVVVGAPELALIQQRMEQLGLGKLAKEVGLSGYGAIRNLGLLVADTLGFDAVVFLDDDEVVDDPDFLQRAVYGLGKLTKKGIPILAKTGYYFNSDGVMMTGFVDIDGNSYYFSAKQNGAMVKSRTVTINKVTYNFDANGVATPVISKQDLAKGQAIVDYALQFVTTEENKDTNRYEYGGQWNGELPYTPTDCSGFTSGVMAHFGITIPRVAADQANGGTLGGWTTYAKAVTVSTSELLPGDLVFYYTPIGHVGIYIGDGKIVHASNSKDGIKISAYNYTTVVKCVRYWSTTK